MVDRAGVEPADDLVLRGVVLRFLVPRGGVDREGHAVRFESESLHEPAPLFVLNRSEGAAELPVGVEMTHELNKAACPPLHMTDDELRRRIPCGGWYSFYLRALIGGVWCPSVKTPFFVLLFVFSL